jgi:DNA-binding MarR family transcriptional regulator
MNQPSRIKHNFEPLENLFFLIRRCSGVISRLKDKTLARESISFAQMQVLLALTLDQRLSISQISDHIGHDSGAMTRVLDALERAQLVRRERNLNDRRTVRVDITDQGRHTGGRDFRQQNQGDPNSSELDPICCEGLRPYSLTRRGKNRVT